MLASFFLVSSLVIFTLAITLGAYFYKSYERDLMSAVRRNDHDMLVQLSNYLTEIVEGSRIVASSLLLDPDILFLANVRSTDSLAVGQSLNRIAIKTLSYPNVHSLVIYDHLSGLYYFTLTRRSYDAKSFIDPTLLRGIAAREDLVGLLPRTLSLENNFVKINENLLSVVLFRNPAIRDSFIAVNINAQELGSRLAQVSSGVSSPENSVYLVDNRGIVVAPSNKSEFGKSLRDEEIFQSVNGTMNQEGTFVAREGAKRIIVSFVKRQDGILVRTSLLSQVLASLDNMKLKTAIVCAIAVLAFLAISLAIQGALLRPLRSLSGKVERIIALGAETNRPRDEVAILDQAFSQTLAHVEALDRFREESMDQLRERFIADVAHGVVADDASIVAGMERYSLRHLADIEYRLVCTRMRRVSSAPSAREPVSENGLFVITLPLSDGEEARMLPVRPGESTADSANRISALVSDGHDWTMGREHRSLRELHDAALEIQKLRSLWFFRDAPGLITPDDPESGAPPAYFYPVATEERCLECIRSNRFGEAANLFNSLAESLRGAGFENAILAITRFATTLFDQISKLEAMLSFESGVQFSAFIEEVHAASKLSHVKQLFLDLFAGIEQALDTGKGSRTREIASRVRAIIDEAYMDPNISVKSISETIKLSAPYVGQLFRQVIGKSVPQYLLDLRMQRARSLIESGAGPISAVARSVGIMNYRYFYTRYKATFGITPGRHSKSL